MGGLSDIRMKNISEKTSLYWQNQYNWTGGNDTGYYEKNITHLNVTEKLLMYFAGGSVGVDIPLDRVTGNIESNATPYRISTDLNSIDRRFGVNTGE